MEKHNVEYLDPYGLVEKKQFLLNLWLHAQPLDLDALVRTGQLQKFGAWYRPTNRASLPDHVTVKVDGAKQTKDGALLHFSRANKKAQRLAESMGVNWRGPRPE